MAVCTRLRPDSRAAALRRGRGAVAGAMLVLLAALPLVAQQGDRLEPDVIERIRLEALQGSRIMEVASYLSDVYGARLTGSPNIREAADWTEQTMKDFGLASVHRETWPFGRGWQNERFTAMALRPRAFTLIGFPKAWTPGTPGVVAGDAIMVSIQTDADFDQYRGKLRGKYVLATPMREVRARFDAPGKRFTDAELAELAKPLPARPQPAPDNRARLDLDRRKMRFWVDEGVAGVIEPGRGDGGTFFVQAGGSREPRSAAVPVQIVLAVEHYGRIARILEKKIPVRLQFDIESRFYDGDLNSFNIVGELPGTDKADEVVLLGAHFDSWHAGTGATDNAAGVAVMLEALRILKATNVKLRRTVRVALWTGEEQGLLGSRAYVKAHLADPTVMKPMPEHGKLSVYFNLDNGTGKIRGVYMQGNDAVTPTFAKWIEPFRGVGVTTLAPRVQGGSDQASFDAVGIPSFQFIQDPIEYDSRTHHSNMDTYERLQANDLTHNAVVLASFAYQAANREERLPRKALPAPQPPPAPPIAPAPVAPTGTSTQRLQFAQ